ncbi:MAG: hypothetical protein ABJD53_10085 [Gammaproteobacteria bacterium]
MLKYTESRPDRLRGIMIYGVGLISLPIVPETISYFLRAAEVLRAQAIDSMPLSVAPEDIEIRPEK